MEKSKRVSTHSRLKAAGKFNQPKSKVAGFNTQPPEGGWFLTSKIAEIVDVSTHSRPKAAGATEQIHW